MTGSKRQSGMEDSFSERPMTANVSAWIITDGKAGDIAPCLGLAEALGVTADLRQVAPRAPWVWAMPWGPIDPREAPDRPGSPIARPFPGLAIAAGRRSVAYLRHVKRASRGQTLTVMMRDPRTGTNAADLIWVPEHDPLRGANVMVTPTSPHRVSRSRIDAARSAPPAELAALGGTRAAVLLGGDSRHHTFNDTDMARLTNELRALAASGTKLMVTASRRTPAALRDHIFTLARESGGYAWDGTGENPYIPMLALADVIVATADSTNMIGEAAATGTGIYVFEASGGHKKISRFLDGLKREGIVRDLRGEPRPFTYSPVDSTPIMADAVRKLLAARGAIL